MGTQEKGNQRETAGRRAQALQPGATRGLWNRRLGEVSPPQEQGHLVFQCTGREGGRGGVGGARPCPVVSTLLATQGPLIDSLAACSAVPASRQLGQETQSLLLPVGAPAPAPAQPTPLMSPDLQSAGPSPSRTLFSTLFCFRGPRRSFKFKRQPQRSEVGKDNTALLLFEHRHITAASRALGPQQPLPRTGTDTDEAAAGLQGSRGPAPRRWGPRRRGAGRF